MSTEMEPAVERSPAPSAAGAGKGGGKRPGRVARTGTYYREVRAELSKVIRPTRSELITYVSVVLVFVTFMVLIVSGIDYGMTKAVLAVFG